MRHSASALDTESRFYHRAASGPVGALETSGPLIDRVVEMDRVRAAIRSAQEGRGSLLLLKGEAGIGKTRLSEEGVEVARSAGFAVGRGSCLSGQITVYLPFHEALSPLGLAHLLEEGAPPTLRGLYLITRSGIVAARAEREALASDADIFAGMLTAVGEFVKDALGARGSDGGLLMLRSGAQGIAVVRGESFGLAAVFLGRESEALLADLRALVHDIGVGQGEELHRWTGAGGKMAEVEEMLRPLVSSLKYAGGAAVEARDPDGRRAAQFQNVSLGLRRRASSGPVILVVDDLQWADPSTLALLHYLARTLRDARVLLLGTYRAEERESSPHLTESLGRMTRETLFEEVEVPRLASPDSRALAESLLGPHSLPAGFFRLLEGETAGNPLYVREVVRALVDSGKLEGRAGRMTMVSHLDELRIPQRVRDVVGVRLERLGEEERACLDAAAVAGPTFTGAVVARMLGEPEAKVLRLLNSIARTHGLVRPSGDEVGFDHPVVREVLYDALIPELRRSYHVAAAEALADQSSASKKGAGTAAIAMHFYRAGDGRAVESLKQAAAETSSRNASEESAMLLGQALELAKDGERFEIAHARGEALYSAARYEEAAKDFCLAAECEPECRGPCLRRAADAFEKIGRFDEARKLGSEAVEWTEGEDRALALCVLSRVAMRTSQMDEAMKRAEEALAASGGEEPKVVAEAHHVLAMSFHRLGRFDEALREYAIAVEIREEAGDLRGLAASLNNTGLLHEMRGSLDDAMVNYRRAYEILEARNDRHAASIALSNMGNIHGLRGEMDRALACFQQSLKVDEEIGDQVGIGSSLNNIASVHGSRGEHLEARALNRRALAIREKIGDRHGMVASLVNLSVDLNTLAKHDEALEALDRALQVIEEVGDKMLLGMVRTERSRSLREGGKVAEARKEAEEGLRIAREIKVRAREADALRSLAGCDAAEGEIEKARGRFREAVKAYEEVGDPVSVAHTEEMWAEAEAARGSRAEAMDRFARAAALFERSGLKVPAEAAKRKALGSRG